MIKAVKNYKNALKIIIVLHFLLWIYLGLKEIAVFKISLEICIICYPNDNSLFTAWVMYLPWLLGRCDSEQRTMLYYLPLILVQEGLLCPPQYHPLSDTLEHDRKKFLRILVSNFGICFKAAMAQDYKTCYSRSLRMMVIS